MSEKLLNTKELSQAAAVLRAVTNKTRQRILLFMEGKEELTVTKIYESLRLEQSACSQHLAVLRKEGIVDYERAQKHRHYFIVHARLQEIRTYARELARQQKAF